MYSGSDLKETFCSFITPQRVGRAMKFFFLLRVEDSKILCCEWKKLFTKESSRRNTRKLVKKCSFAISLKIERRLAREAEYRVADDDPPFTME